ncbi:hypothetical protein EON63_06440 [archaeon]|nr:MAG: hypothetical protein EON63_06440 [archaeon]
MLLCTVCVWFLYGMFMICVYVFTCLHVSIHSYEYICIYIFRTKLAQVFTVDEVRHVFLPQKEVVNSYVLKVRWKNAYG